MCARGLQITDTTFATVSMLISSKSEDLFLVHPVTVVTSKEPVCPRVELILKILIILLIIFLGFIKSKPC